ncbi:MAG: hypothetical protein K2X03_28105 [Bryobacteraceae bacterium]|nr:hypothetical protein [Bryobacteraceae bacterium]
MSVYRSPLHEMTATTPTCLWNDSAALDELEYALAHGATGATCNPVIVLEVLKREMPLWKGRIQALITEMPTASEREIAWALVREISATRAQLLRPVFEAHQGKNGRLSIQTDPLLYRDTHALLAQASSFHALAPNMIVKIPVTSAGLAAFEEATYRGISLNATVSFTVSQCIAVAEAIERGFARREREGLDVSRMGSVCTIMVGRLDDWLKVQAEHGNLTTPGALDWAGVAVFKRAYQLYQQRGYRVRLLAAAYRNHLHWSEFIGADAVVSPPSKWQKRFNASHVKVENRIGRPVAPEILADLHQFPDFHRAYDENGLAPEEFDTYGPTVRTLRQFIEACHDLEAQIRELMLPNPDLR